MLFELKSLPDYHVVLWRAAGWASRKLSAGIVLGLAVVWLLADRMPPFLAAASPATPVDLVRTVPVPYLEPVPPEPAGLRPRSAAREPAATMLQVVARRTRGQSQREGESGALGKAGATVNPEPKADAPAESKGTAAAKPEPPEPDTWSDAEVIAALRDCLRRLAPLGAEVEIAEPLKHERCGAPAPVVLKRIGLGAGRVDLQPPATLNCPMVASLATWVEKTLQPAAQELLGSPIVRIRSISGYSCRNRVGTAFHADRLSEHALANAVDISGFVTADGRTIEVLGQWGPTARELRDEQERAWSAAQDAKSAAKEAESEAAQAIKTALKAERGSERGERASKREQAKVEAARLKEEAARLKEEAEHKRQDAERKKEAATEKETAWRKSLSRTAEFQKLGRGVDDDAQPARSRRGDRDRSPDARSLTPASGIKAGTQRSDQEKAADARSAVPVETAFLRRLHKGACGTFGTVLGPDANEAHRNHFHFDLAPRKRSAFCE